MTAGTLHGDLIVTGSGDLDGRGRVSVRRLGARLADADPARVDGRIIGDDNAFDDEGIGPGWSWDDLVTGYAAGSGALSYNENAVTIRITPRPTAGERASVDVSPPGHGLKLLNR